MFRIYSFWLPSILFGAFPGPMWIWPMEQTIIIVAKWHTMGILAMIHGHNCSPCDVDNDHGRSCCWNIFHCCGQGWGQFHFFNSVPIPILLFSIPIPILPLTISFNSNSISNVRDFNSNSGDSKSNLKSRNDLLKSSAKLIIIMITRYM